MRTLALAIGLALIGGRAIASPDPRESLDKGVALVVQGDFAAAEPLLKQVIAADPSLREAHYNLAIVFRYTQRFEQAVNEYRTALELYDLDDRPNREKCLYGIALADEEAGHDTRAARDWDEFIKYARRFAIDRPSVEIAEQHRDSAERLAGRRIEPGTKAAR